MAWNFILLWQDDVFEYEDDDLTASGMENALFSRKRQHIASLPFGALSSGVRNYMYADLMVGVAKCAITLLLNF